VDGFWEEARRATQLTCGVGVSKVCLPGLATAQQAAVSFTLCQNGAYVCRVDASALPHRHTGSPKHARAGGAVSLEDIFRVEKGKTWNTGGGAVLNLNSLRPALVLRQQVIEVCLLRSCASVRLLPSPRCSM
jgi:hypothetical protein